MHNDDNNNYNNNNNNNNNNNYNAIDKTKQHEPNHKTNFEIIWNIYLHSQLPSSFFQIKVVLKITFGKTSK